MLVIENVEYIKMYDAGEQSIYSLDLFQVGAWGEVSIDVGRGKGNKLTLKGQALIGNIYALRLR